MSGSEATTTAGPEAPPEIQDTSPADSSDSSSPSTTDAATDVAPTRKAKRRPDPKPATEAEEAPKMEEQQPQALMRWFLFNLRDTLISDAGSSGLCGPV